MNNSPHYLRPLNGVSHDGLLNDTSTNVVINENTGALVPYYFRNYDNDNDARNSDERMGRNSIEQQLHITGLRRRRLFALLVWLGILSFLSILLLVLNITLIKVLQMTTHGMRSLQIYSYIDERTKETEFAVRFAANHIDLGHIIAASGKVIGSRDKRFNIEGSHIRIDAGEMNATRASLYNGTCKFENVDEFLVSSGITGKVLFNASNPQFFIDRRIRKIATSRIITSQIRAPINEELQINADNINVRGNEAVHMDAKMFNSSAYTALILKTSEDGAIRFSARRVFLGNEWRPLPISSSPALTASVDAFRICICMSLSQPKLFLVSGNKACQATNNICN